MVDLGLEELKIIDNHCHAVKLDSFHDLESWRSLFSESHDKSMQIHDSANTAFYGRLINLLSEHFGCEATEESVYKKRSALSAADAVSNLLSNSGIGKYIFDDGYPPRDEAVSEEEFNRLSGGESFYLLRLEVEFQKIIAATDSFTALIEKVRELVSDVRSRGYVGFKSIVGYRTGLNIENWDEDQVHSAYIEARSEVAQTGSVRLGYKPLVDHLLHLSLESAASQELPVQFHVAYGDPDVDFRTANPLELRSVLENVRYKNAPIVMLHGCWPYTKEGSYLASVYQNAYLDVSYGIAFQSSRSMLRMTEEAFSVAPSSKILYSSDGARVPDLHVMSAISARKAVNEVLESMIDDHDFTLINAKKAAESFFKGNAARIYGIGS